MTAEASEELREFAKKTGIPVVMTVMGLGVFPAEDPLCLDMLGMHGAAYANYAVRDCDLLLALGVRFDDRVTGHLASFAKNAKIVHVDVDASELNKNKVAHIAVRSDIRFALGELNKIIEPPKTSNLGSIIARTSRPSSPSNTTRTSMASCNSMRFEPSRI